MAPPLAQPRLGTQWRKERPFAVQSVSTLAARIAPVRTIYGKSGSTVYGAGRLRARTRSGSKAGPNAAPAGRPPKFGLGRSRDACAGALAKTVERARGVADGLSVLTCVRYAPRHLLRAGERWENASRRLPASQPPNDLRQVGRNWGAPASNGLQAEASPGPAITRPGTTP